MCALHWHAFWRLRLNFNLAPTFFRLPWLRRGMRLASWPRSPLSGLRSTIFSAETCMKPPQHQHANPNPESERHQQSSTPRLLEVDRKWPRRDQIDAFDLEPTLALAQQQRPML